MFSMSNLCHVSTDSSPAALLVRAAATGGGRGGYTATPWCTHLCRNQVDQHTHGAIDSSSPAIWPQASESVEGEAKQQHIQHGKRQHCELLGSIIGTRLVELCG
jgi:hypothetical protein